MNMQRNIRIFFLLLPITSQLSATFAINSIKPWDSYLWTDPQKVGQLQLQIYGDSTFNERAVWCDHTKICNVLQLYSCEQNALAMLQGFDPSSDIGQFAALFSQVPDDGIRGHLIPSAKFHMSEFGVSAQYWAHKNICLGLYVPCMQMTLNNICWQDRTQNITPADVYTRQLLTGHLAENVLKLGGPIINQSYKNSGIGDVVGMVKLQGDFPQAKSFLTNTRLNGYLGISFPTGKRADEDLLFSQPFGYDGAPGLLFGGALGLTWSHHFAGGIQLNLTQLMGNTKARRIKTSCNQTDFLLLTKTPAHIDWGFIQRYRLYLGAMQIMRGLSFEVAYQFQKQGDSTLSLCNNCYIQSIADSAQTLKCWTLHNIMFDMTYDFGYDLATDFACSPAITFFYQHAFNGRRALLLDKWGFNFVFSF